jgi:hypothetical protein
MTTGMSHLFAPIVSMKLRMQLNCLDLGGRGRFRTVPRKAAVLLADEERS